MTAIPKTGWSRDGNSVAFVGEEAIPPDVQTRMQAIVRGLEEQRHPYAAMLAARSTQAIQQGQLTDELLAFLRLAYAATGSPAKVRSVPGGLQFTMPDGSTFVPTLLLRGPVRAWANSVYDEFGPQERDEPIPFEFEFTPLQQGAIDAIEQAFPSARVATGITYRDRPQKDEEWSRLYPNLFRRQMVIAGSAGVGKSFTLGGLLIRLMEKHPTVRNVALTAYTHVAAKVMYWYFRRLLLFLAKERGLPVRSESIILKGQKRAKPAWGFDINGIPRIFTFPTTVMATWGSTITVESPEDEDEELEEAMEGGLPTSEDTSIDLGVIDEASMVPRTQMHDLMWGAGHPILLVGDPGQLPPVEEREIGVNDIFTEIVGAGFKEQIPGFGNLMAAQNLRTDSESASILDLAYDYRQHIKLPPGDNALDSIRLAKERVSRPGGGSIEVGIAERLLYYAAKRAEAGRGVTLTDELSAIREYAEYFQRNPEIASVITGKHSSRETLNAKIRVALGYQKSISSRTAPLDGTLHEGEQLVMESTRSFVPDPYTDPGKRITNNEILIVQEVSNGTVDIPVVYTEPEPPRRKGETPSDVGPTGLPPNTEIDYGYSIPCFQATVETRGKDNAETFFVNIPKEMLFHSPRNSKLRSYRKGIERLASQLKGRGVKYAWPTALITRWTGETVTPNRQPDGTFRRRIPEKSMTPRDKMHYVLATFATFIPTGSFSSRFQPRQDWMKDKVAWEQRAVREMLAYEQLSLLMAHYGYCITGHASQGSQFGVVYMLADPPQNHIIVENKVDPKFEQAVQETLRWMYVVVTRAKNELQLIQPTPMLATQSNLSFEDLSRLDLPLREVDTPAAPVVTPPPLPEPKREGAEEGEPEPVVPAPTPPIPTVDVEALKLTEKMTECLQAIAEGKPCAGARPGRTLNALERKGLIVKEGNGGTLTPRGREVAQVLFPSSTPPAPPVEKPKASKEVTSPSLEDLEAFLLDLARTAIRKGPVVLMDQGPAYVEFTRQQLEAVANRHNIPMLWLIDNNLTRKHELAGRLVQRLGIGLTYHLAGTWKVHIRDAGSKEVSYLGEGPARSVEPEPNGIRTYSASVVREQPRYASLGRKDARGREEGLFFTLTRETFEPVPEGFGGMYATSDLAPGTYYVFSLRHTRDKKPYGQQAVREGYFRTVAEREAEMDKIINALKSS